MTTVYRWKASRSGASITVQGEDDQGQAVKVTDVRIIYPDRDRTGCVAVTKAGDAYRLRL